MAQFQQNITSKGQLVGGLSLIQINDGLPRIQTFYNANHRVPNYVTYGTTNIPISKFNTNNGHKWISNKFKSFISF